MVLKKNNSALLFYPAIAPYRIDLFNRLGNLIEFKVVFLRNHILYHPELNYGQLQKELTCNFEVLTKSLSITKSLSLKGRDLHFGIWKTISDYQPDVIISVEISFATIFAYLYKIFISPKKLGFIISTAENQRIYEKRHGLNAIVRRYFLHVADSLIVYTEEMKSAYISQGINHNKIFICANHQNENKFEFKIRNALPFAKDNLLKYKLRNRKVLLFVGRLDKIKGIDRLIRAFSEAMDSSIKAVLVLVGEGSEKERLKGMAQEAGLQDIVFAGHLEGNNLFAWYCLASAFILPSHYESYGAVVNESLLAGIPVLCSSYAGAKELIIEGINGFVFDPFNHKMLVDRIQRILRDALTADEACTTQRKNLMPVSFERDVNSFIQSVHYAARKAH